MEHICATCEHWTNGDDVEGTCALCDPHDNQAFASDSCERYTPREDLDPFTDTTAPVYVAPFPEVGPLDDDGRDL
jgi:hypothetical protein